MTSTMMGKSFHTANDSARLNSFDSMLKAEFPTANITIQGSTGKARSSLVLEHWESGVTSVEPVVEMPAVFMQLRATNLSSISSNTCTVALTCYCGDRVCTASGGAFLTQ